MAININDNFNVSAPKAIDNRSGKFISGIWYPYSSVAEANTTISQRHKGLTVYIDDGTGLKEYWYKDGILNSNLVKKSSK